MVAEGDRTKLIDILVRFSNSAGNKWLIFASLGKIVKIRKMVKMAAMRERLAQSSGDERVAAIICVMCSYADVLVCYQ